MAIARQPDRPHRSRPSRARSIADTSRSASSSATEDNNGAPSAEGRRNLDRPAIIEAALKAIDRDGAQHLTMRGLGDDLGVQAMALYYYVSGREDVLEAVIAELLRDLPDHLDSQLTSTWQGYLQALAHAVRNIALGHPNAFPLIATRHPAAPWLRPPLRSLETVEHFLVTLGGFGLTDDQVVETYRSFSSFLLGHLLLEAAARGAETSAVEDALDEGDATIPNRDGRITLEEHAEVVRLRPRLSEDHGAREFETALETLLDRLESDFVQ